VLLSVPRLGIFGVSSRSYPVRRRTASRADKNLGISIVNPPDVVFAYLDPISGSIILQAVIAGALGALLTVKRVGFALREAWARLLKRIKG
jgi:hypothetical protein